MIDLRDLHTVTEVATIEVVVEVVMEVVEAVTVEVAVVTVAEEEEVVTEEVEEEVEEEDIKGVEEVAVVIVGEVVAVGEVETDPLHPLLLLHPTRADRNILPRILSTNIQELSTNTFRSI